MERIISQRTLDILYDRLGNFRDRIDSIQALLEVEQFDNHKIYYATKDLLAIIGDVMDKMDSDQVGHKPDVEPTQIG